MLSKKQLFMRGMIDVAPHMLSVIPFGIICGAIGVDLGFNPYLVCLLYTSDAADE